MKHLYENSLLNLDSFVFPRLLILVELNFYRRKVMEFKLTPEEKELLAQANEARAKGDWDTVHKLAVQIPLNPSSAMAAKKTFGAKFLIEGGYNLSWANAEYGQDWLTE